MLRNFTVVIAITFIVLLNTSSAWSCSEETLKHEICAAGSKWYEATTSTLRISNPKGQQAGSWKFQFADGNNVLISVDEIPEKIVDGVPQKAGQILLVDGTLAIQGLAPEPGYEIDAIDGPSLMYQLAITLLHYAFPDGPDSIKESQQINLTESNKGIKGATASAGLEIPAPWSVEGKVERHDPEITYQLTLHYKRSPKEKTENIMHLSGTWLKDPTRPNFSNDMPLKGWKLYSLGPIHRKEGKTEIFDYGATPLNKEYSTVGELRKSLKDSAKQ